jgi:peptidyl-prolyl cis-trans isomerase SurA
MNKKAFAFFACCILLSALNVRSQTLFTYGSHAVSKDEFLEAYNKNPDTTGDKKQKVQDYLNLYINFRLKLQAAYDEKVNNNAELKSEYENFRTQLTDNFINQQADVNRLLHEAFVRGQKDILLQQVFVPFNGIDTADAYNQIKKAYSALEEGRSFDDVAEQYSTDAATKANKGTVGYITVFTLPYPIENIVYALQPDAFSSIYKSNIGYHIFKNAGERKAVGRRKIQQLLFPVPQFSAPEQIEDARKDADSVYDLLRNGVSFATQLPAYGKNYEQTDESATIEVKPGDYDSSFENQVYRLQKGGDISKPFKTAYGYNIIKLVEAVPVSADENDVVNTAYLQQQIQADGRLDLAKKNLVHTWLPLVHFKNENYNRNDLWSFTDSVISEEDNKMPAAVKTIKPATILFQFEKKKYTVSDWIDYLKAQPNIVISEPENTAYEKLMQHFIDASCTEYYRQHIEDFDPLIKGQLKEFNDANMLFYEMDKRVWSKASQDSAGLKKYYEQHADKYKWNKSVAVLVISGGSKAAVTEVSEKIKAAPSNWRTIIAAYGNAIYADSSRFEQDQLPVKQNVQMEKDFQTAPETNDAGDAFTFIHVIKVYPEPEVRSFDDAKGLVINDYQEQLEKQWIEQLKKEYPVKVNEAVLQSLY